MAHPYVIRRKVDKSGEEEKVLYYAVPIVRKQSGIKELAKIIHNRSTYSEGDIYGALKLLSDVIQEEISEGNTVRIEGLGNFFLSAGSKGFERSSDCTPGKVEARRVCFKMDPSLRKALNKFEFEHNEMIIKK